MKYVFPCIITKESESCYSAVFPDLKIEKFFETDLYDILKTASRVLLLEMYLQEAQRMVVPDPKEIQVVKLEPNQFPTYIICDTELFNNTMDLYDGIQEDDLRQYLKRKIAETKNYMPVDKTVPAKNISKQKQPEKTTSKEEDVPIFFDDTKVIKTDGNQVKPKNRPNNYQQVKKQKPKNRKL